MGSLQIRAVPSGFSSTMSLELPGTPPPPVPRAQHTPAVRYLKFFNVLSNSLLIYIMSQVPCCTYIRIFTQVYTCLYERACFPKVMSACVYCVGILFHVAILVNVLLQIGTSSKLQFLLEYSR